MRYRKSIAVTLAVVFAIAMIPQALIADATPNGATVYAKCAPCHGKDGSKNFPDLAKKTDKELVTAIENGKAPKMPAYKGKLTTDEINVVVSYIKTLKK